ncbi:MAG: tRNA (adenosine(37)-N6)-threonylcarbamoyltransferase complex ATPase subunit type 1 TsaE [Acidothermaceae bacterium]
MTIDIVVATAAKMRDIGRRLAPILRAGDLVVLTGSLGAGKTTLAQGIGDGLGVRGAVTSPTFVIARVHPSLDAGPALVHADAYRLGGRLEVDDLDLDESLADSVTLVEWGEGLVENLSADRLEIEIVRPEGAVDAVGAVGAVDAASPDNVVDAGDEPRQLRVTARGARWHDADLSALAS